MEQAERFAHSANAAGHWHRLNEHLREVGRVAREFAGHASWRDEASLAGLTHDIGKYGDRFQARLHGQDAGLDHWSAGAWLALTEHHAIAAALAIEGHHIGLQPANPTSLNRLRPERLAAHHPLRLTLSESDYAILRARARADGLEYASPSCPTVPPVAGAWTRPVALMLDLRMLFSCLVDADFLDTEAHFEGDRYGKRYRQPGPMLDAPAALTTVLDHMQQVQTQSTTEGPVAEIRRRLLGACLASASRSVGHYTLTAPTGSGKTLAMLAFALAHAAEHGLKRVILAVPYLTIIEQTACIYRSIFAAHPQFGEGYVLEHHSMAGLGEEHHAQDNEGTGNDPGHAERQCRLLAQNWDAPIVLMTNVQLLESLFSNRPSACRKLHNLMDSIILFDEAQSLSAASWLFPPWRPCPICPSAYRSYGWSSPRPPSRPSTPWTSRSENPCCRAVGYPVDTPCSDHPASVLARLEAGPGALASELGEKTPWEQLAAVSGAVENQGPGCGQS